MVRTLETRAIGPRHGLMRPHIGRQKLCALLPPRLEPGTDTASVKRIIEIMEAYRGLQLTDKKQHPEPGTAVYYLSNKTGEAMVARHKAPQGRIGDDYIESLIGTPNAEARKCESCSALMPVIIVYYCTLDGLYGMEWKTFCTGRSGCSHISTARQPATLSEYTLI